MTSGLSFEALSGEQFGSASRDAGGGVKGGLRHGATGEIGWIASENKVHVHDLHATTLHLPGLDHQKLMYRFGKRDYTLTDVDGHVVSDTLS